MQIGGARHECTEASFVDDEILPLHVKLRPQLEAMAAAAKGFIQRLAALGRRKVGEPSRPLGDCCVVYQVSDENIVATRRADRGADPVDVWHDLPRLGNLNSGAWLHESVLEVDDDVRGPRRIEMIKHVSAAPRCPHAIDHSRRNFDFMHAHLLYARSSARRVPLSQRKTMFRCLFWPAPTRTSSETLIPLQRSSSKSWPRSPPLSRSRKPFSGQIVKHGRQFAWHIDHDAVTAAHFHDLPSGDAFIFLCEETKGTRIPIIGKDESSSLDCIGSTRKQDRHFKGSRRLRHAAPVYPIPLFGSY